MLSLCIDHRILSQKIKLPGIKWYITEFVSFYLKFLLFHENVS